MSDLIIDFPKQYLNTNELGKEMELHGCDKSGRKFPISLKVNSLILNGKLLHTCVISDVTNSKELLTRLRRLVNRDDLTGLYNRRYS